VKLNEQKADKVEADPIDSGGPRGGEAWESRWKRISSSAAIEDFGRGGGHDPNDNGCLWAAEDLESCEAKVIQSARV
jgi:hypothetical protein